MLLFLFVGGLTTLLYFASLVIFLEKFGLDYRIGVSISYVIAVAFHFFANRGLTFRANHMGLLSQLLRYLPMMGLNYVLTLLIVFICVESLGLVPYAGAAIATIATTALSFYFSSKWVFKNGNF